MTTPGERFNELVDIMRTLRSDEGCPWDREQTLKTLRPFLLEETYEALEAIDADDPDDLREELGDLLFEIIFLARISEETGSFSIADAIETVAAKLVRRHPHVFGEGARAQSAEEVLGRWEELKREERSIARSAPKTILAGVPKTLPGLLRAYEYGDRAAGVGFDWLQAADVLTKIREEIDEIEEAVVDARRDPGDGIRETEGGIREASSRAVERVEEEVGDLLFAVANLSRKLGVEPEGALRRANDKFAARFTELERRFEARGVSMKEAGLEVLEREWTRIKRSR